MTVIGACVKPRVRIPMSCVLADCDYTSGCGGSGGTTGGEQPLTPGDPTTGGGLEMPPGGLPGQILIVNQAGDITWMDAAPTVPDPTDANQLFISTGGGPVEDNSQWLSPPAAGAPGTQTISVDPATGDISWVTLPAYLINEDQTITLAANTPATVTSTTLANIDTYKVFNTANNQDVTESIDTFQTSDTTIQLQSSAAITVKVEMVGPAA